MAETDPFPAATEPQRLLDDPGDRSGMDDLAQAAVLCRAAQLVRRHVENTVLSQVHLTWNSFDVLQLVVARQPIDTRTIALITGLAKPTISVISTDLAARHLIRRSRRWRSDPGPVRLHPTTTAGHLIVQLRPRLTIALTELRTDRVDGVDPVAADLLRHLITG